jgi:hypothetical protein
VRPLRSGVARGRPFEIVSISIDEPSDRAAAQAKLNEVHASFRNYHYGSEAKDALAEAIDKDWPGPIPHTFLVAPGGKVVYRKTGEFDALELKRAIADAVGRTYAAREK